MNAPPPRDASLERAPPLPKHVDALEHALKLLHSVGSALVDLPASEIDLRPAARAIERSIVSALDAYDARRDALAGVRDAVVFADEARPSIEAASSRIEGVAPLAGWLTSARGWLLVAEDQFLRRPSYAAPPREIVASTGLPTLFRLDRGTLAPSFAVQAPLPPPPVAPGAMVFREDEPTAARMARVREASRGAREAAKTRREEREKRHEEKRSSAAMKPEPPAPGFVPGAPRALTHHALIARRARELFEDIGMVGTQRAPLLGDPWRGGEVFERRLLNALDAMASLGSGGLASLEALVVDAPAKDPSRGFAIAFITGCFEGRDGLAATERALRFLGAGDPEVRRLVAQGLELVPHPDLPTVLRIWLGDEDPMVRALAVEVLGYRRLATPEQLSRALEDYSPDVVAAAMPWAALARSHDLRAAVDGHRGTKHTDLARASAWALALGGLAAGIEQLAGCLGTEDEAPALLPVALGGDRDLALRLTELVRADPTAERVFALGFAGPSEALPVLLSVLSDREVKPEVKQTAAFALQRITGAELFDEVALPPEKLDAPEPADPPGLPDPKPRLARTLGERDQPSDGAPDFMRLPPPFPGPWKEYLAREAQRFQGTAKFRRGRPYTPLIALTEIDTYCITPAERRLLFRELVLRTGEAIPFDPHDFVSVQEASIAAWGPVAQRASSQPGSWGRASRR